WAWQFDINNADYEYDAADPTASYFPNGGFNEYWNAGLDCSGYLGWCVYNVLNTENGGKGYVTASTSFASSLAERGLGTVTAGTPVPTLENYRPGDIVSIKGHVFMIIGVCTDGSVVIAHSTVTESRTGHAGGGVQISAVGWTKTCEAYAVADRFMATNYPEWNARYETDLKDPSVYFPGESGSVFTWSESVLSDPDGIRSMLPDRVLEAAKG
ncbi:MAG: copper amine oxidase N-terminal domain-containing protein, partial [Clostridia bacterium]|nr:copper amine oxidase N-terminal domain-containing protein [Clostridia bacterium]